MTNWIPRYDHTNTLTGIGRLNEDGSYIWHSKESDFYKEWVLEHGDPEPCIKTNLIPESLTAQQKLEASGLTIEDLKELLGL